MFQVIHTVQRTRMYMRAWMRRMQVCGYARRRPGSKREVCVPAQCMRKAQVPDESGEKKGGVEMGASVKTMR